MSVMAETYWSAMRSFELIKTIQNTLYTGRIVTPTPTKGGSLPDPHYLVVIKNIERKESQIENKFMYQLYELH